MDRIKSSADIIKRINVIRNQGNDDYSSLIPLVCTYFNQLKRENLSIADLKFLRYIASVIGIPHYVDMLDNFQAIGNHKKINDIDLKTLNTFIVESSLYTDNNIKIHLYQKQVLDKYTKGKLNRYFLSASTSFGKTFLVYEIIRKMQYQNIILIFPTIALLSENLTNIYTNDKYSWLKDKYDIHTLSDVRITKDYNIFIYTPERYLSFIENNNITPNFVFIDEVYKIDNEYIIDQISIENDRDVAYRLAVFFALATNETDSLLAGPYIEFPNKLDPNQNQSFCRFLEDYKFEILNYNNIEIVNKYSLDIKTKTKYLIEDIQLSLPNHNKTEQFKSIIQTFITNHEGSIVYCHTRNEAEKYAKILIEDDTFVPINIDAIKSFIEHLENTFHPKHGKDWIVIKALKKGIGIHHGLIPKYVQKEIIRLFNEKVLSVLLSTTTITEGVNTSSKNIIVLSDCKGSKPLKRFDAKNIAGRAGRFLQHYSGRVIILRNDFSSIINSTDNDCIKHKNYDINSPKDEIDLFYTKDQYLQDDDKNHKREVLLKQQQLNIPDNIIDNYKVIPKVDKITIYKRILGLSANSIQKVEYFIKSYNFNQYINQEGLEIIIETVLPIVRNTTLNNLMTYHKNGKKYCVLNGLILSYIKGGLQGNIAYYLDNGNTFDIAMHKSTNFIYNILKYHVVKYFGVFNLMYRYLKSLKKNISFEEATGIDKLLMRFEYNCISEYGRIASDFGVPQKVVDYYDNINGITIDSFDAFELSEYQKVDRIIKLSNE